MRGNAYPTARHSKNHHAPCKRQQSAERNSNESNNIRQCLKWSWRVFMHCLPPQSSYVQVAAARNRWAIVSLSRPENPSGITAAISCSCSLFSVGVGRRISCCAAIGVSGAGVGGRHPPKAMCDAIGELQAIEDATGVCGLYTCALGIPPPTGVIGLCCGQPKATEVCEQPGSINCVWLQTPKPRGAAPAPGVQGDISGDAVGAPYHWSCTSPCMPPHGEQETGEVGPGVTAASGSVAGTELACPVAVEGRGGLAVPPSERCIAICPRACSHSR